jgi:hypothetical protein
MHTHHHKHALLAQSGPIGPTTITPTTVASGACILIAIFRFLGFGRSDL